MTDRTLVQTLAAFAAAHAEHDALPTSVAVSTRQRILDVVGLCVASVPFDTSKAALDLIEVMGGVGSASVIGSAQKVPAASAAFVNGVLAHSLDYDDTHLPSILHPSASIVPAALAAGEDAGATGGQVVAATAVGIEICVRLGMAGYDRETNNSLFFEYGQHATSICGGLASAATAALLYGLGADGVANAMGVAASMSSGIIEANRTGGTVKRLHCGWAAHAGIMAAQLVARGFTGPPTVLEGEFGFYQAWINGRFDASAITNGIADDGSIAADLPEVDGGWSVPGIFFKPYPANHFTHGAVDVALELRAAGVTLADVAHVRIGAAAKTVRTMGRPIEQKRNPESGYHAKFSGPYVFAAALAGGGGLGLGLDDFSDDAALRPDVRDLMQRIDVEDDDRAEAIFPHQFPMWVTTTLHDGTVHEHEVLANRGGPGNPLTDDELAAKFADNAAVMLDADEASALRARIESIADAADVRDLLTPAARPV